MVIFAISQDFWMLALGQGVGAMGEGAGAGQPVVSGYIADKTDIKERGSVFSTLAVSNALASTVGSLMAGLPAIFQKVFHLDIIASHAAIFWLGALISGLSILPIITISDVKPERIQTPEKDTEAVTKDWKTIAKFSMVRSTYGLGWGFIQSLMTLYFFIKFGIGGEVLGPIYAFARFLSVFSYMLIPSFVEKWGMIPPLVASRIITAVITILFSLTNWYPLAVGLLITLRLVIMFSMPLRQSFATGLVDSRDTATAIGISNFARMTFQTAAPTIAGYMFETVSLSMPFVSGAIFLISNGLLYRAWFQSNERKTY
jgi:predicted MFS family arabinose efflux permease